MIRFLIALAGIAILIGLNYLILIALSNGEFITGKGDIIISAFIVQGIFIAGYNLYFNFLMQKYNDEG